MEGLTKDQITEPPVNLLKIVSQDIDKRKLRDIRYWNYSVLLLRALDEGETHCIDIQIQYQIF